MPYIYTKGRQITKEEQIRELIDVQKIIKEQLEASRKTVRIFQAEDVRLTQRINWLSHLIRNQE